ncbi:MAG: hypothetical protein JJU23_11780, partial [Cyclobacteriaceae bacterium]|nr:hypothetical protein [Cyclobacteriaceae bacterium]
TEKKKFINHFVEDQIFSLGFQTSMFATMNGADYMILRDDLSFPPAGINLGIPLYKFKNDSYLNFAADAMLFVFGRNMLVEDHPFKLKTNVLQSRISIEYNKIYTINPFSNLRLAARFSRVWTRGVLYTRGGSGTPPDFTLERIRPERQSFVSPGLSGAYLLRANEIMAFELGLNYDILIGDIPNSTLNVRGLDNSIIESVNFSNELRHHLNLGLRVYFMKRTQKRPKSTGHTF